MLPHVGPSLSIRPGTPLPAGSAQCQCASRLLCHRLIGICHGVGADAHHHLTSDAAADCEQVARITAWRAGTRAEKLPPPERCRYCVAAVRRALWRFLRPETRAARLVSRWEDSPDPAVAAGEFPDDASTPPEACLEGHGLLEVPADEASVDALRALPPRERQALELHVLDGLDGADLGAAMGLSADSARKTLDRAKARVRAHLAGGGGTPVRRLGLRESERMMSRSACLPALWVDSGAVARASGL